MKLHVWRLQLQRTTLEVCGHHRQGTGSKSGKAAAGLGMNKFAKDAPVHILVVEESANITSLLGGKVKGKHFPLIDIGIVAAHIALAAEAEGLGSCILVGLMKKK